MIIEHNSRSSFYRSPFGAVPCLSTIVLRLFVSSGEIPKAVRLNYRFKNRETTTDMAYIHRLLDGSVYETVLHAPEETGLLWYSFLVETNTELFYYGNNAEGLGGVGAVYASAPPPYQITLYKAGYETPHWFKNSVMYQIFPDRFHPGRMDSFSCGRQDIIRREWKETPFYKADQFGGQYLANDFFGGNLQGIMEKLPYLAELGIDALYLNPIFEAYSNHKYDTGDYENIDPMFGDNALFQTLCSTAEQYGISVILDGVFNHTGSNSRYFNKDGKYESLGAYQSKESMYYPWYKFNDHPGDYECWWGIKTLPAVNESDPGFISYILTSENAVIKKWLRLGSRGWRIDVADELPDEFLKQMRVEVKNVNPQAVLIGEVWEDASNKVSYDKQREYLFGEEFDSIMNYPLRNALIEFACGETDAEGFDAKLMSLTENYPKEAFYSMMNLLSSHDVARILTLLGDAPKGDGLSRDEKSEFLLDREHWELGRQRLKLLILLQMTLPGVPCIYYGDEAGMQGYGDPFNRCPYPWGQEDTEILDWYKWTIKLRKGSTQLVSGELETIYAYKSCYSFARYDAHKLFTVSVNMSLAEATFVRLDLARFAPGKCTDICSKEEIPVAAGIACFTLPPLSWKLVEAELRSSL